MAVVKKPAFGGFAVDFKGQDATIESVMGKEPIPPSTMTKKLWAFIKQHNLTTKLK